MRKVSLFRSFAFALAAFALVHGSPSAAAEANVAVPAGTLVIAGGAVRADNADVWGRIVALAGGKGARIAVLPSAAGNPVRSGENAAATLRRYGADPFVVLVAPKLEGVDFRKAAEDPVLAQRIREAGGVYFAGGDQARITLAMLRPDGARTAVLQAIWDVYQRGGVIAGTSAGAAIMSTTMFDEAPPVLEALRLGIKTGRALAPGLGFIGDQVFIDQHFLIRGRFARMVPAMLSKGYKLGLGVDENSALVVRGQREVEVIGYKGALLVDLSAAVAAPATGEFGVRGAMLSYLDHGDRFDLQTAAYRPGSDKEPAAPSGPEEDHPGPIFSNDILGSNTILDLMERLVDSGDAEAYGVAAGDPRSNTPQTSFAFHLLRTPSTQAYSSVSSSAYSIRNVRLDIAPLPRSGVR